ncbi:hypothetical protein D9613_006644 [Agrocybe pediades]|uniref:Nephrocystin 3-like N-terminal domain-containing protein n=1 Tax=Agrocybe pediades TaxID=84607 RepID=A0A8H4QIU2_9AGAR|nr:hypothetical protein D9613_006644 [Agrocybe pediades]
MPPKSIIGGTLVTGGTFNSAERDVNIYNHVLESKEPLGIELLRRNVAVSAFHNSAERFDSPKCHPQTRKAVLKEIMDWVKDDGKHQLLWLYGPAGAGKSSIAHTVAEMCNQAGLLAADFFFSRTAPDRNHDKYLVASIVYQLTLSIPQLRQAVTLAVERDPHIFARSISAQVQALIIEPFYTVRPTEVPGLVVIDGLDECLGARSQSNIISALSSALEQKSFALFFLIASRPEHAIRNAFESQGAHLNTHPLALDNAYDPDADIRLFLRSKFEDIRKNHPSGSSFLPSWPSPDRLERLVEKSSGQFIYASTVMKFVEEPGYWPDDRLDIVFGLSPPGSNTPFAELDTFYTHILSSVKDFDKVRTVFYFLIFTEDRVKDKSPRSIEKFLNFRYGELQTILCDLHSVLFIPNPCSPWSSFNKRHKSVTILHASLPDFLMDKSRSRHFFLDSNDAHAHLAQCYQRIVTLEIGKLPSFHYHSYLDYSIFLNIEQDFESILHHVMNASSSPLQLLSIMHFATYLHGCLKPEINLPAESLHVPELLSQLSRTSMLLRSNIPRFLQWTEREQKTTEYINVFDSWLLTHLEKYPKSAFFHVLAAFSINASRKDCMVIAEVLKLGQPHVSVDYEAVMQLDSEALGFITSPFVEDEPSHEAARSILSAFFKDSKRSGEYCISQSRCTELAQVLVEFLENHDVHVRNRWASISGQEIDMDKRSVNLLTAVLSQISPIRQLGVFLRDKPLEVGRFEWIAEEFDALLCAIMNYISCSMAAPPVIEHDDDDTTLTLSPTFTSQSRSQGNSGDVKHRDDGRGPTHGAMNKVKRKSFFKWLRI